MFLVQNGAQEVQDIQNVVARMLKEQFDVELNLSFKKMGKNRVYAYKPCNLVEEKHSGIYFGTIEKDGFRLSIEGSYIVGRKAKKGVVKVDRDQVFLWMKGEDIEGDIKGYVILKWGNYYLGCGKGNGKIIKNFIPKNRRIK